MEVKEFVILHHTLSEKLILGLVFSNRWVEQKYDVYKMYNDSASLKHYQSDMLDGNSQPFDTTLIYFTEFQGKNERTETFKASIQTFDFHISKVIKFGASRFSFVPSILLGMAYYKRNSNTKRFPDFSLYKSNLSVQLNYGKLFFGGGLASGTDLLFGFAGYKNDKIKIMGSYDTFPNTYRGTRSFELSVNYNFKSKKDKHL